MLLENKENVLIRRKKMGTAVCTGFFLFFRGKRRYAFLTD